MSFFEKTTAFFNKIEEWNEEQKKVFKEKQFQKQKKELKKFVKKMKKQKDRKSTRLNTSHRRESRIPSSA